MTPQVFNCLTDKSIHARLDLPVLPRISMQYYSPDDQQHKKMRDIPTLTFDLNSQTENG